MHYWQLTSHENSSSRMSGRQDCIKSWLCTVFFEALTTSWKACNAIVLWKRRFSSCTPQRCFQFLGSRCSTSSFYPRIHGHRRVHLDAVSAQPLFGAVTVAFYSIRGFLFNLQEWSCFTLCCTTAGKLPKAYIITRWRTRELWMQPICHSPLCTQVSRTCASHLFAIALPLHEQCAWEKWEGWQME